MRFVGFTISPDELARAGRKINEKIGCLVVDRTETRLEWEGMNNITAATKKMNVLRRRDVSYDAWLRSSKNLKAWRGAGTKADPFRKVSVYIPTN